MDELGDGGPDELASTETQQKGSNGTDDGRPNELASTETQQKGSNGTDDGWEKPEGPTASVADSRSTESTSEQAKALNTELAWEDGSEDELA